MTLAQSVLALVPVNLEMQTSRIGANFLLKIHAKPVLYLKNTKSQGKHSH